ncbi:MAG: FecR family protein [Pedobacter sp.]|nr:MAG: FecR family protein [Pedobacter sp.]
MDKQRLKYLIQGFMDKTLEPVEQRELLQLIEANKEEDFFEIISELIETSGREEISLQDWTEFLSHPVIADIEVKPVAKIRSIKKFYRSIAAAVILLLISFPAYFYFKQSKKTETVTLSSVITPGKDKAVLIMEDGRTIELDKDLKTDEVLSINPAIKSISDGELVYSDNSNRDTKYTGVNILRTPRGGQYRVVLPDGTVAWLNADSELKYPSAFKDDMRQVELKGEAYFEVTSYPDKKWPFIVKSIDQQVQVLGTKFNISAYDDDDFVKTSLIEGKVKVLNENSQKTVFLKPGQEAALDRNSNNMTVYASDVEQSIAWKEGLFIFNNENLYVAMNKIARWYDVEIVYKGDLKDKSLWGTASRNEKLETLLKTLQATRVAKFKIEERRILVMR